MGSEGDSNAGIQINPLESYTDCKLQLTNDKQELERSSKNDDVISGIIEGKLNIYLFMRIFLINILLFFPKFKTYN